MQVEQDHHDQNKVIFGEEKDVGKDHLNTCKGCLLLALLSMLCCPYSFTDSFSKDATGYRFKGLEIENGFVCVCVISGLFLVMV